MNLKNLENNNSISVAIESICNHILEENKDINKKKVSNILEKYGSIHFLKSLDNEKKADFSGNKGLKKDISKFIDKGILKKKYLKILKEVAKNEANSD